jgi:hypothetical protein
LTSFPDINSDGGVSLSKFRLLLYLDLLKRHVRGTDKTHEALVFYDNLAINRDISAENIVDRLEFVDLFLLMDKDTMPVNKDEA